MMMMMMMTPVADTLSSLHTLKHFFCQYFRILPQNLHFASSRRSLVLQASLQYYRQCQVDKKAIIALYHNTIWTNAHKHAETLGHQHLCPLHSTFGAPVTSFPGMYIAAVCRLNLDHQSVRLWFRPCWRYVH